jgi:coenzyme F420 hydrogenase subunit beta
MTQAPPDAAPAAKERWTFSWKHLYDEVVTTGLCTGCAGCVVACPHDVLSYDDTGGRYKPIQVEDYGGPADCSHGDKACTSCTRACPRFRAWEPEIDGFLFGRARRPDEVSGVFKDIFLARASDPELHEAGQDGGLVSAMLVYALEHDVIDAALVSYLEGDGTSWKAVPGVARTRADVLASAGSRYTYSANTLAYLDLDKADERIALVGMSCQSSIPPVMKQRKAGKVARRLALSIGLLCSKTFDDAIFDELLDAKYGLPRATIKKMNIKGRLQVWTHDGGYHEVPLKECHAWTREGCKLCPDFAAEHADISTGGIGKYDDWTLTVVRTDAGRELIARMLADGWIETRPGDDDPDAIALMHRLSAKSRKRWPESAPPEPRALGPEA